MIANRNFHQMCITYWKTCKDWSRLSCRQASDSRTHGRTHRQMQATTIPEGQNWPRVKIDTILEIQQWFEMTWHSCYVIVMHIIIISWILYLTVYIYCTLQVCINTPTDINTPSYLNTLPASQNKYLLHQSSISYNLLSIFCSHTNQST